jgi:hypothetical protein
LSDSDDERCDQEDRYEHDDEGSIFAESTEDTTEAASEYADVNTGKTKKKKTTGVAKPRKKVKNLST